MAGHNDELFAVAVADGLANQTAMRLSPPFAEIYYNRGDLRLGLGDRDGALADFSYVLELDPTLVDAYVNRASIYLDDGDLDAAYRDACAGLRYEPGDAYLHVVLGRMHASSGDLPAAIAAYDTAIAADARIQTAWAGRAEALFDSGDAAAAITSLDRALDIAEDAALLFNRAAAFQAAGRWADALTDLHRARELDPADPDIGQQIQHCQKQLASQVAQGAASHPNSQPANDGIIPHPPRKSPPVATPWM
jgi:tetratricopeptide (TPR) repeat protein